MFRERISDCFAILLIRKIDVMTKALSDPGKDLSVSFIARKENSAQRCKSIGRNGGFSIEQTIQFLNGCPVRSLVRTLEVVKSLLDCVLLPMYDLGI